LGLGPRQRKPRHYRTVVRPRPCARACVGPQPHPTHHTTSSHHGNTRQNYYAGHSSLLVRVGEDNEVPTTAARAFWTHIHLPPIKRTDDSRGAWCGGRRRLREQRPPTWATVRGPTAPWRPTCRRQCAVLTVRASGGCPVMGRRVCHRLASGHGCVRASIHWSHELNNPRRWRRALLAGRWTSAHLPVSPPPPPG
jgi:hypothetical protein